MKTMVEMMFEVHGKLITDENLAMVQSWKFPTTDDLVSVVDILREAFVHTVITEEDIFEHYMCYMLERHALHLDKDSNNDVYVVQAEEIQGKIYESFDDQCGFLTTYLILNNDIKKAQDGTFQQNLTTNGSVGYGDTLLRAVWIDKLMGYNSNIQ